MDSKEYVIKILKDIGYSGSKTELRKEYNNLYSVIKPQKSRFGDEVYLNFGIIYRGLMNSKTPKLKDCQLEFRFRQMIMALKKDQYNLEIDHNFHQLELKKQFIDNLTNILDLKIKEFDNLSIMKSNFPKNIPVLDSEEEDVDYTEVVDYYMNKKKLKDFFEKNG